MCLIPHRSPQEKRPSLSGQVTKLCFVHLYFAAQGRGRGLFATRDIKKGEAILQERPLLAMQVAQNRQVRCIRILCLAKLA
jgi:hypothetical protein